MLYQDAVNQNEREGMPPYRYESEAESKNGWRNETDRKTGDVTTTTTQDGRAELAPVVDQDFRPVSRSVQESLPAYLEALGVGSKPLKSAEETQRESARVMALRSLGKGLEALGHSVGANAGGASGYVNKDTRDPLYITAFNNYSKAIPNYNTAVAKQNAALIQAQSALEKMGLNAQMRYDLNDQNKATIVDRNNTKYHNDAYKQWAHDNADKVTQQKKVYNTTTSKGTSYGSNTNSVLGVRQEPSANGSGSGRMNDNANLPTMVRGLAGRDKFGNPERKGSAYYNMKVGDFKNFLADIDKLANSNVNEINKWGGLAGLSGNPAERQKYINTAKNLKQLLEQNYYNAYGKNSNTNLFGQSITADGKTYNFASLPPEQLAYLWRTMSDSFLSNGEALKPLSYHFENVMVSGRSDMSNAIPYSEWAKKNAVSR